MKNYTRQYGDFATALEKVAAANQTFATPKEVIADRMNQGVNSEACKEYAWLNASFSEVNGDILATKGDFNPLSVFDEKTKKFIYAQTATDATRTGEFYLDNILLGNEPATEVLLRVVDQDKKKPIHLKRVINLGKAKTHDVPTDCYADDDTIAFLSEGQTKARKYGLFVRNAFGDNSIPFSRVYMQGLIGKNKCRGFVLGRVDYGVGDRSYFDCFNKGLCNVIGSVFGGMNAPKAQQKI
ncbi:hypothetical protein HYT26_04710 [Candidatus Pacearchaeota archaeon]|nr:hypothetical protein [Candidatus Pacearchaeota archaeon]